MRTVIDGHNDLAHVIRQHAGGDPAAYGVAKGAPGHTDLDRLRRGGVGAQFWAAFVPCELAGSATVPPRGAARHALEQIEVIRRLEACLPDGLIPAWSAAEVQAAAERGRIASLIGVEGGHALEDSLAVLRTFRALGARYLTLTHNCTIRWADSATDDAVHGGLTPFGREVVRELNRLGMLVDLSHTSPDVMRDALEVTEAPVAFTHSSARALTDHPRNVPDDVLEAVRENGGVVMVTWVPRFVSEAVRTREGAEEDGPPATLSDVADHMDHVRTVAGAAHVGIGGDLDGTSWLPEGLEDASAYPALLEELAARGWSDEERNAAAAGNVLRVMRTAEEVGERLRRERPPSGATIEELDGPGTHAAGSDEPFRRGAR
ncbi:MAG TPA: dipeptidase [Longimicrobiales bacterium]|nr:dipeptidase [Longimicrobiales bacterium]